MPCRWPTASGTMRNSRPRRAWPGHWAPSNIASPASIWAFLAARRSRTKRSPCPRRRPRASLSPTCRRATRCSCRWRSPGPRCWGPAISSSESMPSTIPAIPTAGRNSSPPSRRWPTSPPRPGWKARVSASTRRSCTCPKPRSSAGAGTGRGLCAYRLLLSGGRGRARLRPLRRLSAPRPGVRRSGRARSHPLPLAPGPCLAKARRSA